jgi:hypothetical protein
MRTCEDFEIDVGRAQHGALDPEGQTALAAHLSSCPSCRAFAEAARRTEGTMAGSAGAVLSQVDWTRIERIIRRRLAELVGGFAFMVVFMSAVVLAVAFGLKPPGERAGYVLTALPGLLFVVVAYAATSSATALRLARLDSRDATVAWLRRDLGRRARVLSLTRWPVLAFAGWEGWRAISAEPSAPLRDRVALGCVAAGLAGVFAYVTFMKVPRLRRDLAAVAPAEPRS